LEDVGMKIRLPKEIKITVLWDTYYMSVSAYSLYKEEVIDICRHFHVEQLNLFTIIDEDVLCEWIDSVYQRKPESIFIDQIIY
jgi:hypothetical protein